MKITTKLLLLVSGIVLLIFIGNSYFVKYQLLKYFKNSQIEWVGTLTNSLSESVAQDTINGNKVHVRELLKRIAADEAVEYVYVTDMHGQLFTHSFDKGFPRFLSNNLSKHSDVINDYHFDARFQTKQGEIIEYDTPLVKGLSARIHLGLNQKEVNKLIAGVSQDMYLFFGFLALFCIVIAGYIGRRISLPLTHFTEKLVDYRNSSSNELPGINTSDPDIKNLVNVFRNVISERDKAEQEQKKYQQRLSLHRKQSPIGIIEWTTDFKFIDYNPAAEKIFGFTKNEVIGKHIYENILPDSAREQVDVIWEELISNTGGMYSVNENITKDGKIIICEWNNTPLIDDTGKVVGVASFVEDVTQRQQQEEQIRRSQKMDALGKLTGGISHDYNNMLGIVMGYSELLEEALKDNPGLRKYAQEIIHAGERGRKLTKLLSFSRQKDSEAKQINVNEMLLDNKDMLEKTLTVRIKLEMDLSEKLCNIFVDENDFEDLLINMSINAMHAMEQGGQLTLATRLEHLSEHDALELDLKTGDYMALTITDTGHGMDKETMSHIFEPFYSTKGQRGTGLGLSQVYGFVSRSYGSIKVYSEIDHGTRFAIYFPCYKGGANANNSTANDIDESLLCGTETILVVDDEAALGRLLQNVLEAQGYTVLIADGGKQALGILETSQVDAVISDIVMPEMDGYELVSKIKQRLPKMKIQLVSGFNDARHQDKVDDELQQKLLYKPVNTKMLLQRIRRLLDDD